MSNIISVFQIIEEFELSDYLLGEDSRLKKQKELFIQFLIARSSSNESLVNSCYYYIENKQDSRYIQINSILKKIVKDLRNGLSEADILFKYSFINNIEAILLENDNFNKALSLLEDFRENQSLSITKIIVNSFVHEGKYLILFFITLFLMNDILIEHISFNQDSMKQLSDATINTPIYIKNKFIPILYSVVFIALFFLVLKFLHFIYKEHTEYIYKLPFKLNFKYYEDYLSIFNLLRLFEKSGKSDSIVIEYLANINLNNVITKQFKNGVNILKEGGAINEIFTKDNTPLSIKDKIDNGVLSDKKDQYYGYIIEDIKKEVKNLKELTKNRSKIFFGVLVYGLMLWFVLDFYIQVQSPLMDFSQLK
jgi:hypothetical protein